LGDIPAEAYLREGLTADLITRAPLHRAWRRPRGYDQSLSLAHDSARRLGLRFLLYAVKRVRATEPQTQLGSVDRLGTVADAFTLTSSSATTRIEHRRVLLIDDVIATGSAPDAIAAALAEAGPAATYRLAPSRPDGASIS
jgi:predicted amidophosphoribosyltransferase